MAAGIPSRVAGRPLGRLHTVWRGGAGAGLSGGLGQRRPGWGPAKKSRGSCAPLRACTRSPSRAVDSCKESSALIGPTFQKRWRQPPALLAQPRSAPSPLAQLLLPFRTQSTPLRALVLSSPHQVSAVSQEASRKLLSLGLCHSFKGCAPSPSLLFQLHLLKENMTIISQDFTPTCVYAPSG